MSHTATASASQTFTTTDIQKVVRRFRADIIMIAQSTGALSESEARDYADDMDQLAQNGFLSKVDVTYMQGGEELRASLYTVNTAAGELTSSNPGGVRWPVVANARIRVTVSYTSEYTDAQRAKLQPKLAINWVKSTADTSHSQLKSQGGRDYASNGWGMQRKDFA